MSAGTRWHCPLFCSTPSEEKTGVSAWLSSQLCDGYIILFATACCSLTRKAATGSTQNVFCRLKSNGRKRSSVISVRFMIRCQSLAFLYQHQRYLTRPRAGIFREPASGATSHPMYCSKYFVAPLYYCIKPMKF